MSSSRQSVIKLEKLSSVKSILFSRTSTFFSGDKGLVVLKPFGRTPIGLSEIFKIGMACLIASGEEQLTKKASIFLSFKTSITSFNFSFDLNKAPFSSSKQKLIQIGLFVIMLASFAILASLIEDIVSHIK